jgi:hypothetical protein
MRRRGTIPCFALRDTGAGYAFPKSEIAREIGG